MNNSSLIHAIMLVGALLSTAPQPAHAAPPSSPPKLTVVLVIDQFAYHYVRKLRNHFKFGFKYLLDNGVNFTQAHHPHGATCTGTGHAALGTGTYAKDHGIVLNKWFNHNGQKEGFHDTNPNAQSFFPLEPNKLCAYGHSAQNLMVDGISDQLLLRATAQEQHKAFALSYKPRAAISMAGHLGKAVWFDHQAVGFSSSKPFFKELPSWLTNFNKEHDLTKQKEVTWNHAREKSSEAYAFENIENYKYITGKKKLVGTTLENNAVRKFIPPGAPKEEKVKLPYVRLPQANDHLLKLAQSCLNAEFTPDSNGNFLLWVSLSSLDMLGHSYGPESLEAIDMIYHLDEQIMNFINFAQNKAGKDKTLFVLTADHGVAPIPEHMQNKGFTLSKRIEQDSLFKALNEMVEKEFGLKNLITKFKTNQFYLDHDQFDKLSSKKRKIITRALKNTIMKTGGIKNVWTFDELTKAQFNPGQLENNFKQQLFKGRSGDLICMPKPYCAINKRSSGTAHRSPYEYDTHIPLIMYQPNRFENKIVNQKVLTLQLPVTLAKILHVDPPSASTVPELPQLFEKETN